ncbi:MAG TPA: hypothetical protein VF555_07075 [Variovorax sp.]
MMTSAELFRLWPTAVLGGGCLPYNTLSITGVHFVVSTTATSFFAIERNAIAVRNFAAAIRTHPELAAPSPEVVVPLRTFFGVLSANFAAFDEHCTGNIEWLGERFIGQLVSFVEERSEKPDERLIDVFVYAFRFLCELEFSQPGDLSFELRGVKRFAEENLEKFEGVDRQQLIYASYTMPANLTKRILQHSSLADFKSFSDTAAAAKQLKETWDKEIAAKKIETEALNDSVSKLQTKFNFVGLVQGFEILSDRKRHEIRSAFYSLLGLGLVMIMPVSVQLGFVLQNIDMIDTHRTTLAYSLPPLLALELILLYFFRIVLSNHRNLQAQLLQLDLRVSLCQFIQSYSEYSTKIKKTDASALERFESVVFSAIAPDPEKMPSTFDGLEPLSKLLAGIRGK